jgi:hypothetical protein
VRGGLARELGGLGGAVGHSFASKPGAAITELPGGQVTALVVQQVKTPMEQAAAFVGRRPSGPGSRRPVENRERNCWSS